MIVVNATIISPQPSGLGVFARELFNHLAMLDPELTAVTSCKDQLAGGHVIPVPTWVRSRHGSVMGGALRSVWTQVALPRLLRRIGARLLLSPNHEVVLRCPCPQVAVIYDLLPLFFPEQFPRLKHYFRFILPRVLKTVAVVVAGSESTKRNLVKHYGLESSRIRVIYPGGGAVQQSYPKSSAGSATPYLLYVGNQYPYKNLQRLIEAFSELVKRNFPHQLILAGKKDPRFFPDLQRKAVELGLATRVKFVDYVSKEQLPRLYAEAALFVFPSLYEGFGLPVLEAMAYGCPVVAANGSSIPEVCGEAALYFDPTDVGDIVRVLAKVLTTSDLRAHLTGQGDKRVHDFDWGKTADQYYSLLSAI